ncbi:MAG: hypothetical protein ORN49_05040 [Rhodobacteraceae bacterium]|nr:hypothetical protein [Paracoccaceae bacterium]
MSDFLSREMLAEMEAARKKALKKKSRLRIMAGEATYPVLRLLPEGFTLDADQVVHLRGLVDLYDGARHLSQCLIMASDVAGGELICTMKWQRHTSDMAPVDYVRDDSAPVAYLPGH